MNETKIKAIYGFEPHREGEYPTAYIVEVPTEARAKFAVTRIERREENFGTYGISWFDVYVADVLHFSVNATAVAEIHYAV